MADISNFIPFPGLANPHLQTVLGAMAGWYGNSEPLSRVGQINLPDGDKLSIVTSTPAGWKGHHPTVIMMHGLCGSSLSPYMLRMTRKLMAAGYQVVRVNLRGCGHGQGLASKTYHGGISDDFFQVVRRNKETHPDSPVTMIGFSLSGNILLKLAGEMGPAFAAYAEKVIAVCPSIDLKDSAFRLQNKENLLYKKTFLDSIIQSVEKRKNPYNYRPKKPLKSCTSMIDFDNLFTAPLWGFEDAFDYYEKCSSIKLIPSITVPCHILFADDDPIVNPNPVKEVVLPKNIDLVITAHGGHMGFLGHPKSGDFHWMDAVLFHWVTLG